MYFPSTLHFFTTKLSSDPNMSHDVDTETFNGCKKKKIDDNYTMRWPHGIAFSLVSQNSSFSERNRFILNVSRLLTVFSFFLIAGGERYVKVQTEGYKWEML